MSALAIIPARGGSKRIPRKNIKEFCGKPIITYSIETALQCGMFDEVMVSTDDSEIAEVARKAGAKVPFMRSPNASNDYAGIIEVLDEVYSEYLTRTGPFGSVCCIFPTAPLLRPIRLAEAAQIMTDGGFDSVFPVVRFGYPIWRSFRRSMDGAVTMNWPDNYPVRSQDLPPAYHDAGQFYWFRPEICFPKQRMFTDNSGSIEIPETEAQDVDTIEDWQICELKFRMLAEGHGDRFDAL